MSRPIFGNIFGLGRDRVEAGRDHLIDSEFKNPADSTIKRRPRLVGWIVSGGSLLIVAIIFGTVVAISNLHDRAVAHTEREQKNVALVLAAKIDGELQAIRNVQDALIEQIQSLVVRSSEEFQKKMSGHDVHLMLRDKRLGLPQVGTFTLINAQGKVLNFSRAWPIPDIDVSDREFFKALQRAGGPALFISEPVRNRYNSNWIVHFARKITAPSGEFIGLLLAGLDLEYFEKEFQKIGLGSHGTISLQRDNGVMLVRTPRIDSIIGRKFSSVIDHLGAREHGSVRLVAQMDGKDRLLTSHRLASHPFIVSVGMDGVVALAGWRYESQVLITLGLLSIVLVAIVTFLIARRASLDHLWSRERLALEKRRLDTAVNNMTQGLLLFDSSERITVCNRRYIQMYGLSPDVVKPGCTFRDLIAHRKETGTFEGDIERYCSAVLNDLKRSACTQHLTETIDGRSVQIVNTALPDGGWVATHEDITERKRSEEKILYLAHYDVLTGLPNRTLLREQLERSLKWVDQGDRLAILYLDLDHFKTINDTLGHPIGDALLKVVSERLRGCLSEADSIARLGGDEFAIVQGAVTSSADVKALVKRIFEVFSEPYDAAGHQIAIGTSIGIAVAPDDGVQSDLLLKNADLALYQAKSDGRNTYRFFAPELDARANARRKLEFDLRQAVMGSEFELYYQPLVNLRENKVSGCEALLRWHHPERGMISPLEFIPIAEETGLISQIGEWVLRTACAEAMTWPGDIKVSVNVSPVQFKNSSLVATVVNALAASRLPPHRLELEITEAVLIQDDETALHLLYQLREMGVRIAMDDFGTGYSSLSYLMRFPFDKIKIDRSFVKDIAEVNGSISIVQAVIDIAKSRDMTTTAEGVETTQQVEFLRKLDCTEVQGYLFNPPRPAAEILQFLLQTRDRVAA